MFGDEECELWGDLVRILALPLTSCDVLGTYLASPASLPLTTKWE